VTARPAGPAGGIGHAGWHLNCTLQSNGAWTKQAVGVIPPQALAALRRLADEISDDLATQHEETKGSVEKDEKKRKDDEDRGNAQWKRMGFKTPGSSTTAK
jgi:hypothetical protein